MVAFHIQGVDHVQLAAPEGCEDQARAFFSDLLGMVELKKPAALQGRGGVWFACGDQQLHIGVQEAFVPAQKAHPAFAVRGLQALAERLQSRGFHIHEDVPLPGQQRLHVRDPFGNRLEFVERVQEIGEAAIEDGKKRAVQEHFGKLADAYVKSETHANGPDLALVVNWLNPSPDWIALDIATGGGHMAKALASNVASVICTDLTPEMLAAARAHLSAENRTNVHYVLADAESLPFLDETFDVVACRIAAHHFVRPEAFLCEVRRVLRPSGHFVLIDNVAPEDPSLGEYMNTLERLRDESHVRCPSVGEWEAWMASAGLRLVRAQSRKKTYDFASWVRRTLLSEVDREQVERFILSGSPEARDYFSVETRGDRLHTLAVDEWMAMAQKA